MNAMGYPLATGNMLKAWGTTVCPVCDTDMIHLHAEDDGGLTHDTYTCSKCEIMVTYISPEHFGEYHQVPDGEKFYMIEGR